MKIIADKNIPFLKGVLEPYANVEYYHGAEITASTIKDADALIVRTRTKCNAKLLEGSKVKFIATATIGFDHIDTEYCKLKGISWANAPGCNAGSVMQYVASALAFLSGKYKYDYRDKVLGIVGVGNVGSKVANIAEILGMKVLLNDPPRERLEGKSGFVSLKEIKEYADIITFHVPLIEKGVDKTFHLADEFFFKNVKSGAVIINTSRGGVVSTEALKQALLVKKIKAAVLDVWENEPYINLELQQIVDIGTPHIAGYSVDGKAMGTAMCVRAVSNFFGFDLNNWMPDNIPEILSNKIEINCNGKSVREILNKAILAAYDITKDNERLKNSPETFEWQRENYPVRREYKAWKVHVENNIQGVSTILKKIGFKMI
jgi:erythronate-4-phosphate dehydrogenase